MSLLVVIVHYIEWKMSPPFKRNNSSCDSTKPLYSNIKLFKLIFLAIYLYLYNLQKYDVFFTFLSLKILLLILIINLNENLIFCIFNFYSINCFIRALIQGFLLLNITKIYNVDNLILIS